MRHARSLLPYVATALVIALGGAALVLATVPSDDAAGTTVEAIRSAPQLSPTGRLAYWRQNPAGAFVLSVANFDGSLARALVTLAPSSPRPFATRWTGDGRAVAYATETGIAVASLDGTRTFISLPPQARNSGFSLIDQRWSPSGDKVAATLFRSTDGKSDVYLGSLGRPQLAHVADLGNAFAADWLSDDELLVESDRGALVALRESGAIRKVVAASAASPFIDRGRVYYFAGTVSASGNASGIFVNSPAVSSVLPDGTSARTEDRIGINDDLKLDGRWPDGRYLVHRARDATQYLAGPAPKLVAISSSAGATLRRVVLGADRRTAIGFGGGRLVRIDLSRTFSPPDSAFIVLLDGVVAADVWVRRDLG